MAALLDSNIADLNARIQALDTAGNSPLSRMLKQASFSRDELEKDRENNDSIVEKDRENDSITTTPSKVSTPPRQDNLWGAWEKEWASLRLAELKLSKQHRGETAATVLKRDNRAAWVVRNQSMVDWQSNAGWITSKAEAYTCVALGGQTAIGQDLREGGDAFVACRQLLFAVLAERALRDATSEAPPTYRHLTGRYSLSATDAAWAALLAPDAAPGLSFCTTGLTIATDDASAIDAKGYRVGLSRAGGLGRRVEHFHEPQDSDVVCFRALPTEVTGTPVDEHGWLEGKPAHNHVARRLVQTSAVAWHLPPLATVTLAQVVAPGEWAAYGRVVARRLLVVNVAFECSA